MGRFQVLLIVLLTGIALELGLIAVKLPTPAVHAAPMQAPGIEDPHEQLKRQIAELQRDLAGDRQRLMAIEEVVKELKRWTGTTIDVFMRDMRFWAETDTRILRVDCYMMTELYFKPRSGPMSAKEAAVEEEKLRMIRAQGGPERGNECRP